eukprot:TRINITY_DN1716_c0_g1::TRINITY_DN1716_c0_g1_i1::g.25225::m.25225 TRINITY_DN1716_c0_g1::TRINITY_DN1716_c0_g1_i1::g.25225  ORF type:complete len:230 (+),score=77.09,sp/Q3T0Z7/DHPR_BOVIN/46.32/9e-60,adh_short/PF00106.20/0.32,adh_short/PF00106.20/1.1e-11,Epimerase/PF01370.16/1.7e-05,KR/PF08659.5/28,KR/PF08659.5/3.4e-05,adh_short_C2/PF13561.1/24,adh_short_C2/PF13561.1/0.024,Eno-Rase_NADH_b/PF12242.3/0.012,Eno-Rase_NADH_b/PF12242.3/1.7e+03,2-Hacid_dh_C/PF02826.14/0.0093,RmlD_sub_bind/PF04321.12/0.013,S
MSKRTHEEMTGKSALIIGSAGALGSAVVKHFKEAGWKTIGIDFKDSEADVKIKFGASAKETAAAYSAGKVDAVLNLAGGWAGGDVKSADIFDSTSSMIKMSVDSTILAAHLAANHMNNKGLFVTCGSAAALSGTPGMVGYGAAKAAVHQITESLAKGGLPEGSHAVAILPETLDTPMNRQCMPDADFSSWTPLSTVAEKIMSWADHKETPEGVLIKMITREGNTAYTAL